MNKDEQWVQEGKAFKKGGGIIFMTKDNALAFVRECINEMIPILGIDGFYLTEKTTQPSMEHSIDFTHSSAHGVFDEALIFLENQSDKLHFEIVYGKAD